MEISTLEDFKMSTFMDKDITEVKKVEFMKVNLLGAL